MHITMLEPRWSQIIYFKHALFVVVLWEKRLFKLILYSIWLWEINGVFIYTLTFKEKYGVPMHCNILHAVHVEKSCAGKTRVTDNWKSNLPVRYMTRNKGSSAHYHYYDHNWYN